MALPSRYGIDKKINSTEGLSAYENGGKGSGNWGHAGRPGEVGGSGKGTGTPATKDDERSGLEKDLYEKKQAKIDRIKEKIGKDIDLAADDLSNDPWRDMRYITITDKDGEEYSYDAINEQVHKKSSGEEMLAPSVKKALADKGGIWNKPSWEIKGTEIKKKLKEYGINTEGMSVSRKSGGYSDAWYISGSGKKTDLKSAERILKAKLESYERDVSGEILLGGNTYVFVTDTDRNSFSDGKNLVRIVAEKIDNLEKLINGGKGSGNFGHSGRPGKVGGSGSGMGPSDLSDQEAVDRQDTRSYDYSRERSGVSARDGFRVAREFDSISAELATARTNLKMLEREKDEAYKDLSGRRRFMDRSSEISRSLHYAESVRKSMKMSQESREIFKAMESELKSILDKYRKLGTKKYFDPDLNHEN